MNKKFVAGIMLVSAMGALTACSSRSIYDACGRIAMQQAEESRMQERFINVSASSEVKAAPDKANVYLGAEVSRGTAPLAEKDVRKRASKLVEVLKEFGISESCIKTTDYSLYPCYEYVDDSRTLTGYQASMTVEVSGIDIEMVSDVISKATEAGVNTINGIEYTCSKYDDLYADALADAISIAEVKAQRMADAAHVELGYAVSINEGYQNNAAAYNMKNMAYTEAGGVDSGVAPGEIAIEASVSIAYSLGDEIDSAGYEVITPASEVQTGNEVTVRVDDTGKQVEVYLEPTEEDVTDEIPVIGVEIEEPVNTEEQMNYELEEQANEEEHMDDELEQKIETERASRVYEDIEVNTVGPDDAEIEAESERANEVYEDNADVRLNRKNMNRIDNRERLNASK